MELDSSIFSSPPSFSETSPHQSVFVALDTPVRARALEVSHSLEKVVGGFKIGMEAFVALGPGIVEEIGPARVFLDLKFHDIPNTVACVSRVVARMGVQIFNVHCLGGLDMMRAAVEAARQENPTGAIIGVTVLTSHDAPALRQLGIEATPQDTVRHLAALAREAGLDGVVCSAQEIAPVRAECGDDFLLVTPGIRPRGAELGDQKRVLTPREALQAGASYLVVGRPITGAPDPIEAAKTLFD